jgi:hypothetical protein
MTSSISEEFFKTFERYGTPIEPIDSYNLFDEIFAHSIRLKMESSEEDRVREILRENPNIGSW